MNIRCPKRNVLFYFFMHTILRKGESGAPNWGKYDPKVIKWKYFTKWISASQTLEVIDFLLKNTGIKKAWCIYRTIHRRAHRRWGGCGQTELLTYQVGSSCQLLPSALGVLILPVSPGGGWGVDVRGAELLLPTSHTFNSKQKLTGKSTECCSFSCALYSRGYLRFLISRSVQTLTTTPNSITPIITLETGGGMERLSLRMTDCCPLGFPDPWNRGCISKIHSAPPHFSPQGFQSPLACEYLYWWASSAVSTLLHIQTTYVFVLCCKCTSCTIPLFPSKC